MSESKTLRPVGRIDFLDTKGQTGESCYYYTEEDFLKTVKEENYYGVPMVVNVFRDENGQTIPLDFVNNFDPLPQGFKILDYKEGEDMNDFRRLEQLAKQYKALYPKGTQIELEMMGSDPRPIEPGTRGTVDHVDDLGTIHCTFDNGRRLGIIPEEDSLRNLTQYEILDEQSGKLQMAYIDKVNKEVIPYIEWVGMKNAYKYGDMSVPTDLLRMLHEKYLEVYGTDHIDSSAGMITVPALFRRQTATSIPHYSISTLALRVSIGERISLHPEVCSPIRARTRRCSMRSISLFRTSIGTRRTGNGSSCGLDVLPREDCGYDRRSYRARSDRRGKARMKKIRYLDMFAGVGGFRTGLTNAGDFFVPVGWCEIDPFAQKAYRALYETEGEYFCDDATRIKYEDLPEIDLITAGFPCQPFSVSGRRLGFADTRGTLFHEIVRVAETRRPPYLLLENVPGLLGHEGGKLSELSLPRFMSWGILLNGVCLTARISESRNSVGGYILSDILIADCPEKYFLSPRAMERLLGKLYPEDKDKESTHRKEQAHV